MSEKRKPYASITIYKPRSSRLVATALLLLLILALGSLAWREIDGWQTALKETRLQLQERTALLEEQTLRLQALESQLAKAEGRLRTEPLAWRTLEPAGFSVEPSMGGWQGLMTATVCARGHSYYESYTHFFSLNRFFVAELTHGGNYELVGRAPFKNDGAGGKRFIYYYTHKDALDFDSYKWETGRADTSDHIKTWRNRLASYCSASFE